MGNPTLDDLQKKNDAAWANLGRQLQGMEPQEFMGTDEISLAIFTGAMFDYHWQDHAGQLAKIRKAAGLPEAK